MGFSIRTAAAADAPAVLTMIEQLRERDDDELAELTVDWVAEYLSPGGDEAIVAEADGVAVGILTYRVHDDLYHGEPTSLIEELVVEKELHGQGIGTALLEECIRRSRDVGCTGVAVNTGFKNERAQALYKRVGLTYESLMLSQHFGVDGKLGTGS